jgi:hypothetical protein
MKSLKIILSISLVFCLGLFGYSAQANTTPTLTKNGVTLSFANPVYTITSSTSVILNYTNNSGYELSSLSYQITDRFGTVVAGSTGSAYSVRSGTSGNISDTWFGFEFANTSAPYTFTMKASYLFGSGRSAEIASTSFEFAPRVAVLPTPAPTVTVTAKPLPAPTVTVTATPAPTTAVGAVTAWAEMETLKAQVAIARNDVKALQAKLKKICAVKPKPKGC